jgi:hypothetical protein
MEEVPDDGLDLDYFEEADEYWLTIKQVLIIKLPMPGAFFIHAIFL